MECYFLPFLLFIDILSWFAWYIYITTCSHIQQSRLESLYCATEISVAQFFSKLIFKNLLSNAQFQNEVQVKLKMHNFSSACAHEIKKLRYFSSVHCTRQISTHEKCHETQEIRNFMRVSNLYMPAAPQILAVMCDQCGIGMVKVNF